jgi:hypothetical protein
MSTKSILLALALGAAAAAPSLTPAVALPGPITVAQTTPVTPHCTHASLPQLAVTIDRLLPTEQLAQPDLDRVTTLRAQIADFAQAGNEPEARRLEEQAMSILGYEKVWLRCGRGSFMWVKRTLAASALTQ